jgi:hypothetical protein
MFENCENLTTVELPEELEIIHEDAFWGCKKLALVEVKKPIKKIEKHAFWGCPIKAEMLQEEYADTTKEVTR